MFASKYSNNEANLNTIKLLIKLGADINAHENNGDTALIIACKNAITGKSSIQAIKLLIDLGCDINALDNDGWNALMSMYITKSDDSSKNFIEITQLLLESGIKINQQSNGRNTILMFAANYIDLENIELVELLLKHNANVNLQNENEYTALMLAVENNQYEFARLLLENGADINIQNINGNTTLLIAIKNKLDYKMIKLLLDFHADSNIINNKGQNALLLCAKKNLDIKIMTLLIGRGCDYYHKDNSGGTLFSYLEPKYIPICLKVIEQISRSKGNMKLVLKHIPLVNSQFTLSPTSINAKITNLKWNFDKGNIDKIISINNFEILDYIVAQDLDNLRMKIDDLLKYSY
ncbi:ankyrin repeat protein [Moumouvirus australiensis]|uniref:Ankyrin repeat protein n=1 Tax=Moumouvirus australiensis TaxID=2109587 RepID=A0A2P1EKX5_9VIRU|nr:ankyrin repeat protein [Moumouvirus australiensis]AVL94517.1 ankyrin repeat protein [Moumouvirus australiensis]